jgi:hypothetical protein
MSGEATADPGRRRLGTAEVAFASIVAAGFALRVGVAELLPNVLWPDEIFQTLEQAHRVAFGYGIVPWEFRVGARSWLLPGALAGVMKLASFAGDGPTLSLAAVRVVLVALSMSAALAAWAWSRRRDDAGALVAAAATACWFELVYFAPKALSEVVAGHVLVTALFALDGERGRHRLLAAGALLGLVVALRLHLAPAAAVAIVWAVARYRRRVLEVLAGVSLAILVAGVLDLVTWGSAFHSYWSTFRINVVEGKSESWGVLPWAGYGWMLRGVWGPVAVPLLALAGLGARRKPLLLAVSFAILATHSAIPHKEWRFVYPAVLLVVVLAAIGSAEVTRWARRRRAALATAVILTCAWISASAWRGTMLDSAATLQRVEGPYSHWTARSSVLRAFDAAREQGACGVALVGIPWFQSGGYSRLHLDVPLFLVRSAPEHRNLAPAFDAWIAPKELARMFAPDVAQRCWTDGAATACLYRRPGGCARVEGYSVNDVIAQRGQ